MSILQNILPLHAERYPEMEVRDCVKLIYQSEFGPGHMVSEGNALPFLEEEFDTAQSEDHAPAYTVEAIGGGLCRYHLDPGRLTREDLPLLGRCFALSARPRGSREGLWRKLGELMGLVCTGQLPFTPEETEEFLADYDAMGCPALHHSEAFDRAYRPHYRVLDRDLALYGPTLRAIDAALREGDGPILVAVDGRCASGKSTFAARCGQLFDCSVFHMDDFFLPPELRTPDRLSTPGGNVHYERAAQELFEPLLRGENVTYAPFDCSVFAMGEPFTTPFRRLNIIEGSYALHPDLLAYSQVRIFLTCSPEVQLSRLGRRETPESLENFKKRWIPMEENYFGSLEVEKKADIVVDTSKLPTG